MAEDESDIVQVLSTGGVEFIVIGGLAAQAHGSARLTQARRRLADVGQD